MDSSRMSAMFSALARTMSKSPPQTGDFHARVGVGGARLARGVVLV
jgi:hypothetical protein